MEKITYHGRYRWEVTADDIHVYDEQNDVYVGRVTSFAGARMLVRKYERLER